MYKQRYIKENRRRGFAAAPFLAQTVTYRQLYRSTAGSRSVYSSGLLIVVVAAFRITSS